MFHPIIWVRLPFFWGIWRSMYCIYIYVYNITNIKPTRGPPPSVGSSPCWDAQGRETPQSNHGCGKPWLPYGDGSKPYPPGEHQNSWYLWMFIPLKMVCIGIDP